MVGLYIHVPFCVKKCKYCDFVSFEDKNQLKDRYIDCLIDEMKEYPQLSCDTVFIGGGTPSSLSARQLKRITDGIADNFKISENAEITCEANPGTLSKEKLKTLKNGGVNRLSIGVQSFNDNELKNVGRIHTGKEADGAIALARKCGFDNISIDIMSALPGQTFESFKQTLVHAVSENPEHISCYSLILEENTPLYSEYTDGKLILPDEDTEREMYDYACQFLNKHGYEQYEISNFAKDGKESKHNVKYWRCEEYVGIGAAAHSYYKGKRFSNTHDLCEYLSGKYHSNECEDLSLEDKAEEFMIMGLRMTKGIRKEEFERRFGLNFDELFKDITKKFVAGGFMEDKNGFVRLTHKGISVSNSIMCEFTDINIKKIG